MPHEFVHLHVHTEYSILDGACRTEDLAATAKEMGMPAVACTDHGNMSAAVEFYRAMLNKGIKPILGCEFYVAPEGRKVQNPRHPISGQGGYHLVLLAENWEGYQNLCRLNSAAWLEGFYYKPRIDLELLGLHNKGLLALTACLGGEIPRLIIAGDDAKVHQSLRRHLDIFGRDRLYLELQENEIPEQTTVNNRLVALAREYGLPLVATNDAHYLKREHAKAHELLLCIQTKTKITDEKRMRFTGDHYYFKSPDEMHALFAAHPEALKNTLAVAERCNVVMKIDKDAEKLYPVFDAGPDKTAQQYLREICVQGLRERYGIDAAAADLNDDAQAKIARMDYELGVIAKSGFTDYFLVVWDFINFARRENIAVGPGRGSGAGSLVAYLTQITDIDPLRYNLLFERFLNPERVSPPDFDIDFCERRRPEVIAYVRRKYGEANVSQIGTFGTMKAKAVVKDVGRAMGCELADVNGLAKMMNVPKDAKKQTLEETLKASPELVARRGSEPWVGELLDYSEALEGLTRNMGVHAAGVLIGKVPLAGIVPLAKGTSKTGGEAVTQTQFDAAPCEALGLLKMDFLGLSNLTIIQDAVENVFKTTGKRLDVRNLPLDDPATYELLNKGDTVAVFQLESSGMRDLCRRFGVNRLEDIIALIALYRPGPMEFLDEFLARKSGRAPIDYDVPEMEPVLAETYGIMLYQEQVMQTVQVVAGFSLGQADILRRAMGKKKPEEMAKLFEKFVAGAGARGISENVANSIWDKISKFAGYGFNKSHSAAYAMVAYQTAYLKANYPREFMAAYLSSKASKTDELIPLLAECREMNIPISPPDVNKSDLSFTVDGERIRFGLAAIKNVGEAAAIAIIEARKKGAFKDLSDFCERVGSAANRRVMENICKAGGFDCFGWGRAPVFAVLDQAISMGQRAAQDRASGQGSLFDFLGETEANPMKLRRPAVPEWENHLLLAYEKELLGAYVSGHPLAHYADIISRFQTDSISGAQRLDNQTPTRLGGIISTISHKLSKKDNSPWAIITLEGLDDSVECLFFSEKYKDVAAHIVQDAPVFVEGLVSRRDEPADDDDEEQEKPKAKILGERILPLKEAPEQLTTEVHVHIYQASCKSDDMNRFRRLCDDNRGNAGLVLCLICSDERIAFLRSENVRIANSEAFRHGVKDIFGEEALAVQKASRQRPEIASRERRGGNWSGNGGRRNRDQED